MDVTNSKKEYEYECRKKIQSMIPLSNIQSSNKTKCKGPVKIMKNKRVSFQPYIVFINQ